MARLWSVSVVVALLGLPLVGCGGSGTDGNGDGGDTGGTLGTDSSGGADTGFASDTDSGFANGTGGGDESCRLVDVVIAVDGSSSMTEELTAMRQEVFPAFAARLAKLGKGLDNFRVATLDACPTPANYHTQGKGGECAFVGGKPWIDSTSTALNAEFSCVGDIFQGDQQCTGDNDDEQPASAIASSLEPPYSDGPNAGFLRADALLVVVAITDEDEQPTGAAASAEQVYARLVEKKGDVTRMVFLGIGGSQQCEGVYGSAEQATKLKQVTDLFSAAQRGVWWDLCQGHLEDGLDTAFQIIEQACNEFTPLVK